MTATVYALPLCQILFPVSRRVIGVYYSTFDSLRAASAARDSVRRRWNLLDRSACLAAPSLLGCTYLNCRGLDWGHGDNRSCLAYKLFCVFYPGILPCACLWFSLASTVSSSDPPRLPGAPMNETIGC